MTDDLIAFVQAMDLCWIERRLEDLSGYIGEDVVMVAPGGKQRMEGLGAAIGSYAEFMTRCEVSRFDTSGHVVTRRGSTAVVEYNWSMAWTDGDAGHEAAGRELLVLAEREAGWRVVWRTQLER